MQSWSSTLGTSLYAKELRSCGVHRVHQGLVCGFGLRDVVLLTLGEVWGAIWDGALKSDRLRSVICNLIECGFSTH